ncbi:MAG: hypothetical protein ACR2PQ_03920 [Myxococcota bacterium]
MKLYTSTLIAAFAISLPAATAWSSIPGNVEERSFEGLLHVCVDSEPGDTNYVVCEEQEDDIEVFPYTGSECVAASLPASCVIDFLPSVAVTGKLTLMADDDGPRTAILFEFGAGGQRHVVADIFDTDELGNWNPLSGDGGEEVVRGNISVQDGSPTEFQFSSGNLRPLADQIREILESTRGIDLSGTVAVFTSTSFKASAPAADGGFFPEERPTASTGVHVVTLRFARVRP